MYPNIRPIAADENQSLAYAVPVLPFVFDDPSEAFEPVGGPVDPDGRSEVASGPSNAPAGQVAAGGRAAPDSDGPPAPVVNPSSSERPYLLALSPADLILLGALLQREKDGVRRYLRTARVHPEVLETVKVDTLRASSLLKRVTALVS